MKTIFRPRIKSFDDSIRLRKSLLVEDAFTTTVHEMLHHWIPINHLKYDKIIDNAARAAGYDKRYKINGVELYCIAGRESDNSEEVIAYAIEMCSINKGSKQAQAIYESFRNQKGIK